MGCDNVSSKFFEMKSEYFLPSLDNTPKMIKPPITRHTTNMMRVGFPFGSIGITQSAVTSAMVSKIYIKAARTEIMIVIGIMIYNYIKNVSNKYDLCIILNPRL